MALKDRPLGPLLAMGAFVLAPDKREGLHLAVDRVAVQGVEVDEGRVELGWVRLS